MTELSHDHEDRLPAVRNAADAMLAAIRPHWVEKRLIERTKSLLPVDPSSACQRLFNAAIHDLRDKIVLSGIDIASTVAADRKMPSIRDRDDVMDHYSVNNVIDLAYGIGLLSRPEWRRLRRCYDIRRDLEHEDDEYEAQFEDVLYIFKTSIDVVLSRDPIHLLRVDDVKELVESTEPTRVSPSYVQDFRDAPEVRQLDIIKYLISKAMDAKSVQIVQSNAVEVLRTLSTVMKPHIRLATTEHFQTKIDRRNLSERGARVATACGISHLLDAKTRAGFFQKFYDELKAVTPRWTSHDVHGEILTRLEDCGGLSAIPKEELRPFVSWLLQCYLGEKGGRGYYGANRKIFYSNIGSPRAKSLIVADKDRTLPLVDSLANKAPIKDLREYGPIEERYQKLLDELEG
ncbi:MAG: hypothetical protein KIT54_12480 [Phycisphaeraceae bacterium]|nr:hypothetical protein [Phycisphaeraceae bacterium]